jgi:hypothetical protein
VFGRGASETRLAEQVAENCEKHNRAPDAQHLALTQPGPSTPLLHIVQAFWLRAEA